MLSHIFGSAWQSKGSETITIPGDTLEEVKAQLKENSGFSLTNDSSLGGNSGGQINTRIKGSTGIIKPDNTLGPNPGGSLPTIGALALGALNTISKKSGENFTTIEQLSSGKYNSNLLWTGESTLNLTERISFLTQKSSELSLIDMMVILDITTFLSAHIQLQYIRDTQEYYQRYLASALELSSQTFWGIKAISFLALIAIATTLFFFFSLAVVTVVNFVIRELKAIWSFITTLGILNLPSSNSIKYVRLDNEDASNGKEKRSYWLTYRKTRNETAKDPRFNTRICVKQAIAITFISLSVIVLLGTLTIICGEYLRVYKTGVSETFLTLKTHSLIAFEYLNNIPPPSSLIGAISTASSDTMSIIFYFFKDPERLFICLLSGFAYFLICFCVITLKATISRVFNGLEWLEIVQSFVKAHLIKALLFTIFVFLFMLSFFFIIYAILIYTGLIKELIPFISYLIGFFHGVNEGKALVTV
ncbi:hypothetical protein NEFER03_0251 [Nematocida sp. LUAm3]|nr:hypothetical protein NEFER03_0251 [Nematocida sp. LUAm3]KAI5173704.1 hypothetical protein NEFER02_0220 [Nematocida sp. LUAm2]KAI5176926.1 hypothetical protein NEFER01_0251 [Nematocida sp. LUAm1]